MVIFVVAILASIGLHELGHMIPAKKFGGKVTQYFIGFGPTVWSKQVGETEYGVKAIPLGGYVKIVGMLPPGADQLADEHTADAEGNDVVRVRKSNTGMFTQLISDARAAEWETIRPEDADRLFYKMPWWKKVIVMAGGPTVNIADRVRHLRRPSSPRYGNPSDLRISRRSSTRSQACVVPAARTAGSAGPTTRSPRRAKAGLQDGDRIVAFNGTPITRLDQLQRPDPRQRRRHARRSPSSATASEPTLTTNTMVTARPDLGDATETLVQVGFLGVAPTVRARAPAGRSTRSTRWAR